MSEKNTKLSRRKLVTSAAMITAAVALDGSARSGLSQAKTDPSQTAASKALAVTGISSIWFSVTDWQRARKFYENVLGFRPEFLNDETGIVSYFAKASDPPIFLIKKHGASPKHPPKTGDGVSHGGTVGFLVSDAKEIMKHVAAFGGSVSDQVEDGFDSRVYTIYDPDGNVLELTELKKAESGKK